MYSDSLESCAEYRNKQRNSRKNAPNSDDPAPAPAM